MATSTSTHTVPTGDTQVPPRRPPLVRRGPALRVAYALSVVVAALMVVQSVLGLAIEGLYPEETWAVAALRGNDLVTLALVSPALVVAVVLTRWRPSTASVTVWLGLLYYGVYNYAYYAFGAAFNDAFLLHVGALSLSVIALILLGSSLDVPAVAAGVADGARARVVAVFTALVGAALLLAWGGLSIRFAVTGQLPDDVMPPSAIHLVYAIDMSLLAPAFLVAGVMLWRRMHWGAVMAVAVNVGGAAYLTVLEVVGGFQADAGIAGKSWLSPVGIGSTLLCVSAVVLLLVRSPSSRTPGA